ncbi:MAG: EAL domain-containing protein [Oxalobacter formigenes]|nr:EAL domain-containing protein [Oxalobacter formigenes]
MANLQAQNIQEDSSLYPSYPSIRAILIAGIVLLLFWAAGSWLIADAYHSWQNEQTYLETQELAQTTTDDLQKRINEAFSLMQAIPAILSQNVDIQESILRHRNHGKDMITRPEKEIIRHILSHSELRANSRMLEKTVEIIGTISALWVTEEHGFCIAASNAGTEQSILGKNFSPYGHYRETSRNRSAVEYSSGYFIPQPGLYFSSPILINNQVIGAVTAKISLTYLYQWLSKTTGLLVDRYGVIIYASNPSYLLKRLPDSTVYKLSAEERQLRYKKTKFEELSFHKKTDSSDSLYMINGEYTPYYVFAAQLKNPDLTLMTTFKRPSQQETIQQTIVYFFLLLLAGFIIILGGCCLNYYIRYRRAQNQMHIRQLISRDALTGFYNRSMLIPLIDQKISQAKLRHTNFAILFMDIDLFKDINDSFGHEIGDEVLQQLSGRIKSVIRETDIIIRHAGDDFIILLDDTHAQDDVAGLAKALMVNSQQPFYLQNKIMLTLSVSVGIVLFPDHGDTASLLMRHADTALYFVKQNGRNNYSFYRSQMSTELLMRKSLENDMEHALENNEFFLVYQPQYCYAKKGIVSCEALIRWNHPVHGIISPATFIPIAEHSGFIKRLGEWILNEACRQAGEWRKNFGRSPSVAVNLSAIQFQDDLPELIQRTIACHDISPDMLDLELTESILMKNITQSQNIIHKLKKMGSKVSLDDFGTGYSSLAYLQKFPIDTIKIDQAFVRDMESNTSNRAIINAIISIAQGLNYQVIAEGIETPGQYNMLMEMGCHIIQGYWFSKPLTAGQFAEFYVKNRCPQE